MKKFLVVFLYSFILLLSNFTIVKTDTYMKTESTNEKVLSSAGTIENDNLEKEIKEEILENEQEENEMESSDIIETSTIDDYYIEEDSSSDESYYVNYGTYGRLYIPGHSVALYDYNVYTNSSYSLQEIVDDYDSAAYYLNRNKLVIADHNYQGFSILASLYEGSTSYIEFEDGSTIQYTLINITKGYNTGPDLVDTEGNSFFNMESDIIMYTCYDDGIMVTLWVLS